MGNKQNSHFKRGSGMYQCECCGRNTRDTGEQGFGTKLCPDCWELAGIYNTLQDEGEEGVKPYADEIRARCANIVAKGGTLDGDAKELLAAVGEGA